MAKSTVYQTHGHHQAGETATSIQSMSEHQIAAGQHVEHRGQLGRHEGHSVEGFRKRFWLSLLFTVPVLILSPMLQHWAGLSDTLRFPGDIYLLFAFSSLIFFYGGYPFLKGFIHEVQDGRPGMMTLIAVAISTAYFYSSAVVFGLKGEVFFWETGTLTQGKFGVTDVLRFGTGLTDQELLRFAGAVEAHSEHPIAQGIVQSAGEVSAVEEFRAIPGKGAEGTVNGRQVKVVSPGFLRENGIETSENGVGKLSEQGKTVVYVLIDGKVGGAIALADIIRPESKEAIATLKRMGISSMMLTGDNKNVAKWVSDELGLDEYFAEVLPDQKAQKVKEVQARGLIVAMTGDGINDAPALAQADVGIAIGAGTDVAVETADIVLVKSNPEDVVAMILLARATYQKMVQNLAWATGYNAFAMPLAAGVLYSFGILLSPAMGAVLMSVSTVIVAINARLLKSPKLA